MSTPVCCQLPPVQNSNLDPTTRWQEKSLPCNRERRIILIASAALAAVGAAVTAVGIYGLAAMAINPIATGIMMSFGYIALAVGAVSFIVFCSDQSENYNNPETVKNVVENLRDGNIDNASCYTFQIDALAKYGIIPEDLSCEMKDLFTRYVSVCREDMRGRRYYCSLTLDQQADIMQRKLALNTEWKAFRARVNLAANMPKFN